MWQIKFPISLEIDLTYKCNYNCLYCRNGGDAVATPEISLQLFKKIIEECKQNGLFSIKISGGEPLLHTNFFTIVNILKESGISWNLITNGSKLTKDHAQLLRDGNCKCVFMTLSGVDDQMDGFHKNHSNSFSLIDKAISYLKLYGIEIIIGFLFSKRNKDQIDKLVNYVRENDLKLKPMRIEPLGNALQNEFLCLSEIEYQSVISTITQKIPDNLLVDEEAVPFYQIECEAGKLSCVIAPDGAVYPCVLFIGSSVVAGNLNEASLYDVWNFSELFASIRKPVEFEDICLTCPRKAICKKGCKGRAYIVTNNYHRIDGRCINDK